MSNKFQRKYEFAGVIEEGLPICELSSNAAVIISFLSALCKVNDIILKPPEMIIMALLEENQNISVFSG